MVNQRIQKDSRVRNHEKYNRVYRRSIEQKVSILATVTHKERCASKSVEAETRKRETLVRKKSRGRLRPRTGINLGT